MEKGSPLSALEPEKIAVWFGHLTATEDACRRYWTLLDAAEQARADRLVNPLWKRRHIEAHGLLRCLLSPYLNQPPGQIHIKTAAHGKPFLADHPEWTFNLSHSGNHLVIAMGQHCRLGVDIEPCKPQQNLPQLVKKCFAQSEASYWQALADSEKTTAFYRIWTIKEAFVKATGRGIALGLDQCVTDPGQPGQFLRLPPAYEPPGQWRIIDLEFPTEPDLCGALVTDQARTVQEWPACPLE